MSRGISATILLLLGVALVRLGASDQLLLYVKPSARPWVLLAGIALVLLATWTLWAAFRGRAPENPDHPPPRTAWLVLAPVVAVLVIAPPALGTFTAGRAPRVDVSGRAAPKVAAGTAPVALGVFDFLLVAAHQPAALRGRPVTLTGFVQKTSTGGFTLARLVITCCAADAFAATVDVRTAASVPGKGAWVQVTGTFAGLTDGTPRLAASALTPVRAPADPYD